MVTFSIVLGLALIAGMVYSERRADSKRNKEGS